MIIFLYGSDSYRRQKKLKEITGQYEQKHLSRQYFDFDSKSPEEFLKLKEFVSHNSIFEETKLGILSNVFEGDFLENNENAFIALLKKNLKNKDLTLLISSKKAPLKKFDFLLKEPVLFQEFNDLKGNELVYFIKKEAAARDLKLTPAAIDFLANIFQGDNWALINELEKLSLFNRKDFDFSDLKQKIFYYKPMEFTRFFYALNNLSLANLEILFSQQEEPAKIFNFLASVARGPTIKKLADYDEAIKSGKMDYEEALVDLVL
mgnify:FL=1